MDISAEQVRRLREITGAGMMDCKRALEETGGDLEQAQALLREKGLAAAAKRSGKTASEGVVEAYIHGGGSMGVLVEVNCETDFVANTDEFRQLAKDIALQVAGYDPWWISRDDVPPEVVAQERKIYETQAREQGKPDNVIDKIVDGKLESFYREQVLLEQPFFRDESKKQTVAERIAEVVSKVNEKIDVRRFARFVRGEDLAGT
ncbi:MAG: translation elongation factor Ts [Actinomycetota bacterium]